MHDNIAKLIEFWPFAAPATLSEIHKWIKTRKIEQFGAGLLAWNMSKRPKWQTERQWLTEILMEIKYHNATFKGRTIIRTKKGDWELSDV